MPLFTASNVPSADKIAQDTNALLEHAKKNLQHAQEQQAKFYNRNRRMVTFVPGDKVLLSIEGLDLKVSLKYTAKYIGPLEVLEAQEKDNYRLRLGCRRRRLILHCRTYSEVSFPALPPWTSQGILHQVGGL